MRRKKETIHVSVARPMTLIRSLCSTNELYQDGSSDAIAGHLSNTSSSTMATDESQSDHFERLSLSYFVVYFEPSLRLQKG